IVYAKDAQTFRLKLLVQFFNHRHLKAARTTPRSPEIQQDDISPQPLQLNLATLQVFQLEVCCFEPDLDGSWPSFAERLHVLRGRSGPKGKGAVWNGWIDIGFSERRCNRCFESICSFAGGLVELHYLEDKVALRINPVGPQSLFVRFLLFQLDFNHQAL